VAGTDPKPGIAKAKPVRVLVCTGNLAKLTSASLVGWLIIYLIINHFIFEFMEKNAIRRR
jgi:hypothetical protein